MKDNISIKNSSFIYSVNMLRMLVKMNLITDKEYEKILKISVAYYDAENIYV